jgi:predicted nucleotidyltransferase
LFDLSGKIDKRTVDVLCEVKQTADALGIPFFVVGASARDIILKHCYGIDPARMTRDIDLGVKIDTWNQFSQLTNSLIATDKFSPTKEQHRLNFGTMPLDIVPFGAIADKKRKISWPPEHDVFMSLLGFQEAYEHAIEIRLSSDPIIDIKLPSLPGLSLMKLIAWKDKYPERKKDAQDLLFIMRNYENAGNFERLYTEEQDLLQAEKFDAQLAAICLLGRDMAMIAEPDTKSEVALILEDETKPISQNRLIIDMMAGGASLFEGRFEEIKLQLVKLKEGFADLGKRQR